VRGIVSLKSVAESIVELRVDSAGIQATDMLDWYRAFRTWRLRRHSWPNNITSGAATFRGWARISLYDAAFSSSGGRWTIPGFPTPLVSRAMRGGIQMRKVVVEPFALSVPTRE